MKKMKSLLVIMLVFISLLAGCGTDSESSSGSTSAGGNTKPAGSSVSENSQKGEVHVLKYGFVDQGSGIATGLVGIAKDQGYFEEELAKVNAKVEIIPFTGAGPAINAALASKSLDAGAIGDVPALVGKASGIDTVMVAGGLADAPTYVVAQPGKGYKSLKDLKGKKVATQIGAYMQRVLYLMLEDNGLKIEDVQFVNMTAKDAVNALAAKTVDAIVVSATQAQTLASKGLGELLDSTEGHREWLNSTATIFNTSYAKENPEVVKAFIKGLLRAREYAQAKPSDLRDLQIKAGTPEKVIDLVYPDLKNYSTQVEADKEVISNLKSVAQFLKDNKLADSVVDIDAWYDPSFYNAAQKESGSK